MFPNNSAPIPEKELRVFVERMDHNEAVACPRRPVRHLLPRRAHDHHGGPRGPQRSADRPLQAVVREGPPVLRHRPDRGSGRAAGSARAHAHLRRQPGIRAVPLQEDRRPDHQSGSARHRRHLPPDPLAGTDVQGQLHALAFQHPLGRLDRRCRGARLLGHQVHVQLAGAHPRLPALVRVLRGPQLPGGQQPPGHHRRDGQGSAQLQVPAACRLGPGYEQRRLVRTPRKGHVHLRGQVQPARLTRPRSIIRRERGTPRSRRPNYFKLINIYIFL